MAKFTFPSQAFLSHQSTMVWEGVWTLDKNMPCDIEGWQYAVDFPRTYHKENSSFSCVRRRCWTRYYNYDGYDRWLLIPGLTNDPVKQPFQDIGVGGINHDSWYQTRTAFSMGCHISWTGLIADLSHSYVPVFYKAGSVAALAASVTFSRHCVQRQRQKIPVASSTVIVDDKRTEDIELLPNG